MIQVLFVLKTLKVFPDFFIHVGKWPDKKAKVSLKVYDIINWKINNYNTHIDQYLKKSNKQ